MSSHENDEATPLVRRDSRAPSSSSSAETNDAVTQQKLKDKQQYGSKRKREFLRKGILSTLVRVLPYCIVNIGIVLLLNYFKWRYKTRTLQILEIFRIDETGHQYTAALVAFLMVTRVFLSYQRFDEAWSHFETLCQTTRELVQNIITITSYNTHQSSKKWRSQVAYRSLLFLRTTVAVLEYPETGLLSKDVPELDGLELDHTRQQTLMHPDNAPYVNPLRIKEGFLSQHEENLRAPIHVGHLLQKSIVQQALLQEDEELIILHSIDVLLSAYYALKEFLIPPPFLYIQMLRSLLFLYAFTFPLALIYISTQNDVTVLDVAVQCFSVLLVTLGGLGLEAVAMALDKPFCLKSNFTRFKLSDGWLVIVV